MKVYFSSRPMLQVDSQKNLRYQGSQDGDPQWKRQIAQWRDELGVSSKYLPFDGLRAKVQGLCMTPRVKAILNCVVATKIVNKGLKTRADVMKEISTTVVDVSQNPCRRNFTPAHGTNHTLCTSSQLCHLGRMTTVLPAEMMLLQGWNSETLVVPDGMTNRSLRVLAGNGMCLPCLGTVLWSLLLAGCLGSDSDPSNPVDDDELAGFELVG